jgi:adenine deaminase
MFFTSLIYFAKKFFPNKKSQRMLILGNFLHTNIKRELVILRDYGMEINNGKIQTLDKKENYDLNKYEKNEIITMDTKTQFCIPGFIDTHVRKKIILKNRRTTISK